MEMPMRPPPEHVARSARADGAHETLMPRTPVRATRLPEQVYERLLAWIASGRLAPGGRLPPEGELSELFGVSRPVVRDALSRLRQDRLIVSRQGSGSYVRATAGDRALRFGPLTNTDDLIRCFEFRIGVESEMARLAARHRTRETVAQMKTILRELERAYVDGELPDRYNRYDLEFHATIARASRNDLFVTTLESLQPQIDFGMSLARNINRLQPPARARQVNLEHRRILEAIARGDEAAAAAAMRQHLMRACSRIVPPAARGEGEDR